MVKKSKGPFDDLQDAGVGMAGLAITTGVTAGVSARAPAGTPSLTAGLNTLASFTPIVSTGVGGRAALRTIKKLKY